MVLETRPVGLSEYREFVRSLPRPTEDQIESFIQHVSEDHSWYNQIPLVPPGVLFHFYVDNSAGFNYIPFGSKMCGHCGHSGPVIDSRAKEEIICIETYRRKYGWLNYVCSGWTKIPDGMPVGNHLTEDQMEPTISVLDKYGNKRPLANSILAAGRTELTSIIHYRWNEPLSWEVVDVFSPVPADFGRWPEESGGPELPLSILKLLEEDHRLFKTWLLSYALDGEDPLNCSDDYRSAEGRARRDGYINPLEWDSERSREKREKLRSMLRPERERQFGLIRQAISRVLELLY